MIDLIKTIPNPNSTYDYLVQHDCIMMAAGRSVKLSIRMVPDKDVIESTSINAYLESLSTSNISLEILAGKILDDLLNTLIPRFLHIELCHEQANQSHRIVMEEKQPKWNNQGLLARLAPL